MLSGCRKRYSDIIHIHCIVEDSAYLPWVGSGVIFVWKMLVICPGTFVEDSILGYNTVLVVTSDPFGVLLASYGFGRSVALPPIIYILKS